MRAPARLRTAVRTPGRRTTRVSAWLRNPFTLGFVVTLGGLAAIVLGMVVSSLATILTYVGLALFIALGLDPAVRWFQSKRVGRPLAVTIVFVVIVLVIAAGAIFVVPTIVHQVVEFVRSAPTLLHNVEEQNWFVTLNDSIGETIDLDVVAHWIRESAKDPAVWANATGGLLKFGAGFVGGAVGVVTVLILSIFFLASLPAMKQGMYSLVARAARPGFIDLSERIILSVGGYVNGMVILAVLNAGLGFVAMLIFGVPFAGLLAILVFLITLIPLIGSVLATVLVTVVALFNSPATAIEIATYYLIYMQVEAYILTPRVMNKTVDVPGALVVIGALAGGTLLGIVGALVAIPITAAILLIIKKVVIPRQDRIASA